jgi:hypothetical protein
VRFVYLLFLLFAAGAASAKDRTTSTPANSPSRAIPPIPAGAEYISIDTEKDGFDAPRKVFVNFHLPPTLGEWTMEQLDRTGFYRIEVSPQGKVTAVTVLQSMGRELDTTLLKTFVGWHARPGRLRIVDMKWHYIKRTPVLQ